MRSRYKNHRNTPPVLLEQLERLQGAKLRQRIVGKDDVRFVIVQGGEKLLLRVHPLQCVLEPGFAKLALHQLGIISHILEGQHAQVSRLSLHAQQFTTVVPGSNARRTKFFVRSGPSSVTSVARATRSNA